MLDHLRHGAVREQIAIRDVGKAMTALRLIHIMGGDEEREPFCREQVDLLPEIAPRLRIDAGRGLIQEQELWLVNEAGS